MKRVLPFMLLTALTLSCNTYAGAAYICEVLGDTIQAFDYYRKGIACYERRISNPKDKDQLFNSRFNRACLHRYLGKDQEGKMELEKLKSEKQAQPLIDEFLKMDRQAYLKTLPKK